MTRRDLAWRAVGAALFVGAACGAGMLEASPLAIMLFPIALLALTLVISGKRVVVALRAERREHQHTAAVIHAERVRRWRRRSDHPHL